MNILSEFRDSINIIYIFVLVGGRQTLYSESMYVNINNQFNVFPCRSTCDYAKLDSVKFIQMYFETYNTMLYSKSNVYSFFQANS